MKKILSLAVSAAMTLTLVIVPATTIANGATQPKDVLGHWAEATITKWVTAEKINGYDDGTFKPENKITRAEFMAIVNRAYGLTQTTEISFKDVPSTGWYYKEIQKAKKANYIGGYDDGTMRPDSPITRQEAAQIIAKLNSLADNAAAVSVFKDSAGIPTWSKGAVGAVAEAKIMTGDDLGKFNPVDNLKRAEAVIILDRSSANQDFNGSFTDLPENIELAVGLTNEIVRFETVPKDLTVTASVDTTEYLTLETFNTKLTITTKDKPGITKVVLTGSKTGMTPVTQEIIITVRDKVAENALAYDVRSLTQESLNLFYKDESAEKVTGNFGLPVTGEKKSTITWESDNTAVVKISGERAEVRRPYYTDGKDEKVKLTATVDNKGLKETKSFYVTVLKAEQSSEATVTSDAYSVGFAGTKYEITSKKLGVTESTTVETLLSNLIKHEYAQWKVVHATTTVGSPATFLKTSGKSSKTKIVDGDKLVILAEDEKSMKTYILKTMDQIGDVEDFGWTSSGYLSWKDCNNENGYILNLSKGKELVATETVKANTISFDFLKTMKKNGVGKYTADIVAKGDMVRYANSAVSETTTEEQLRQLNKPENVAWSSSTAKWSGDGNAAHYKVILYKDGVVYEELEASKGSASMDLGKYIKTGGKYTFTVTSIAATDSIYVDSLTSEYSGTYSK